MHQKLAQTSSNWLPKCVNTVFQRTTKAPSKKNYRTILELLRILSMLTHVQLSMLTYVQLWVHEKVTQAKKFNILGSNWIHCANEWLVFISQSSNHRLAEVWTKPKKKTLYSEMHIIFIEIIQTPKKTVLIKGGWQWWQFNGDNTNGGEKDISSVYINFNSKALHNNVMDQHNPACKSL